MLENPELAADNFRIFLRGVRNALKQDMLVYIAAPMDEKIMRSKLIDAIREVGLVSLSSTGKKEVLRDSLLNELNPSSLRTQNFLIVRN